MMWIAFESVAIWSINHPIATAVFSVCLQLPAIALAVEILSRFLISRDAVLKHRLWRLVVALALISIPLHLTTGYLGVGIAVPKSSQTPVATLSTEESMLRPLSADGVLSEGPMKAGLVLDRPTAESYKPISNSLDEHTLENATGKRIFKDSSTQRDWFAGLWAVYLIGVACWLSRIVYAYAAVIFKARKMPHVDSLTLTQIEHLSWRFACPVPYAVRISETTLSPYVFGALQPILVVPNGFCSWTDQARTAVLAHELAHIKRNDFVWSLLARVMAAIYWPHPASWWINKRIVKTRELAADEHVVTSFCSSADYARGLIEVVARFSHSFHPKFSNSPLVISMSAFDDMQERVQGILDGRSSSKSSVRWLVRSVAAAAIACTLLASLKLRELHAQNPNEQLATQGIEESEAPEASKLNFQFLNVPPGPDSSDLMKVLLNCELVAQVETSDTLVFNFKGKVVAPNGDPVEGATVLLMEAPYATKIALSEDIASRTKDMPYAQLPSVSAKTYSASDGSFSFSNAKPPALNGYEPGMWQGDIVAVHKDYGVQWDHLNHSNYKIVDRQTMKLAPTTSVSGVFQTPDGQPLRDAVISLCDIRSSTEDRFYDSLSVAFTELQPTVVTDANGRFAFQGIPESTIAYVQCKHPAWGMSGASFKTSQFKVPFQWDRDRPLLSSPGTIVAQTEVIFGGRITGEGGEPVEGMQVLVGIASTRSDKNGEYTIALPKEIAHKTIGDRNSLINVFPGKGVPYLSTRVPIGIIGPRDEYCETDIVVSKGVWVSGKLVDENDGPAEGIQVFAFTQDGKDNAHGYSNSKGLFGFYVPPEINMLVFSNGSIPYQLPSFNDVNKLGSQSADRSEPLQVPSSWTSIEVDGSSRSAIDLQTVHVKRLKPYEIQVICPDGTAAVDAKVVLEDYVDPGDYFFPVSQTLATNSDGRASITSYGLLSERAVAVTTYLSSEGVTHYRRTLLSEARDGDLAIKLEAKPVIRGRVLVNGVPVAEAVVEIMSAKWPLDAKVNRFFGPKTKRIMTTITNSNGDYAVALDTINECMVSIFSIPKYGRLTEGLSVVVRDKNSSEWLVPDLDVLVEDGIIVSVSAHDRK